MFDSNSRYAKCPIAEVDSGKHGKVSVVKLRRIPYAAGNLTEIKGVDRLDIMAQRRFADGTKFWHIADANTELTANDLIEQKPPENPLTKQETTFILVPES